MAIENCLYFILFMNEKLDIPLEKPPEEGNTFILPF